MGTFFSEFRLPCNCANDDAEDEREEECYVVVRRVPVICEPLSNHHPPTPPSNYNAIKHFPAPPSPLTLDAQFEEVEI